MLDLKNYLDKIEDIEPGETLRMNHTTCEAGEDTRERLYVTRTLANPLVTIAYCHNCQQGGRWNDGNYKSYRDTKHRNRANAPQRFESVAEVEIPKGLVDDLNTWPGYAQAWAISRGLGGTLCERYAIKYDPNSDRIYLPRGNFVGNGTVSKQAGYQLRSLGRGSKYTTVQREDAPNWSKVYLGDDVTPTWAVIVEDLVSAIHVVEESKYDQDCNHPIVYVNHGTKIDPTMLYEIANECKWATVWLDNDNDHVLKQARLMKRTIALYNSGITVAKVPAEYRDPKYHLGDIVRILDEVW